MFDRRRAIHVAVAAVAALCAALPPAARAEQGFQRFVPFLVDLDGWKGDKPDGVSMEIGGNSMVTATRKYQRGEARLDAQVITGTAAQGALAATHMGLKLETSDVRMGTSTVDGLPVTRTYTISSKSGAIVVELGPAALFSLTFNGLADDEALALAKKFDWKAMQGAAK